MRLFEVEDRFTNDLVLVLKNMVGRSDTKDAPLKLAYPAVNSLMFKFGYAELGPESLKDIYDKSDELQRMIKDPSETGDIIVTKTETERRKTELRTSSGPSVDTMAHQASQDYQNKLS